MKTIYNERTTQETTCFKLSANELVLIHVYIFIYFLSSCITQSLQMFIAVYTRNRTTKRLLNKNIW